MPTNTTAELRANLRAELARRDLSQREMAEHLGLSQGSVSSRMRGEIDFTVPELLAVAEWLEVPAAALLGTAA